MRLQRKFQSVISFMCRVSSHEVTDWFLFRISYSILYILLNRQLFIAWFSHTQHKFPIRKEFFSNPSTKSFLFFILFSTLVLNAIDDVCVDDENDDADALWNLYCFFFVFLKSAYVFDASCSSIRNATVFSFVFVNSFDLHFLYHEPFP